MLPTAHHEIVFWRKLQRSAEQRKLLSFMPINFFSIFSHAWHLKKNDSVFDRVHFEALKYFFIVAMSEQTTGEKPSSTKKRPRSKSAKKSSSTKKRPRSKSVKKPSSTKKRPRSKSVEKPSSKKKRVRANTNFAIANRARTNAMMVAIAAYGKPELFPILRKRLREAVVRRDRKLDNDKHFRDWKILLDEFLANPEKYGLKILEELATLGKNSRKFKDRVDNRVFRCVTCDHSDYEDDGIVYAIVIQEKVAGSRSNPTLVDRIMWVCDYGMRILREYDRRIYAWKHPKSKTAYAVVRIPKEVTGKGGKTQEVLVHALLFNKKYRRGPFHETDHIDNSDAATNGLNNLLANVRDGAPDGTTRVNNSNRSTQKDNTSGHKGVCDYKGRNEGGSKGDFGFWQVQYNELDKVKKKTTVRSESFRRIKNGEAHKREMFKKACEFQERKMREYLDDLEEYYKPIRALHDRWFAMRVLKEVLEPAKTSK
jgi:hypothetical protein